MQCAESTDLILHPSVRLIEMHRIKNVRAP
jgi:hypothetical protein